MIHRAWEGDRPRWVHWTERAVASTHAAPVVTVGLSPELPGSTPARRSNVHRLQVLVERGGLWLDCDLIPLVDLTRIHDRPWMGYAGGAFRPTVMFFPEPQHPLLVEVLERTMQDPDSVLTAHIAAALAGGHQAVIPEPRVLPHDRTGNWILGDDQPLATHLWFSSGALDLPAHVGDTDDGTH